MFTTAVRGLCFSVELAELTVGIAGQLVWGIVNLPRRTLKGDEGRLRWTFAPYFGMGDEADLEEMPWVFETQGYDLVYIHTKIDAFRWIDARVRAGDIHPGDARFLRACVRASPLPYIDPRKE